MVEADPHDAANTALLLEREIDKRVAEAMGRLLDLPNFAESTPFHRQEAISEVIVYFFQHEQTFRNAVIRAIRDQMNK